MSSIKELKEKLTVAEVVTICCKALGSDEPENVGGNALRFSTICHNAPHCGSHKLYYYHSTKLFHCYTECSDSFDIIELVRRARKCDTGEAVKIIDRALGRCVWQKGFGLEEELCDEWLNYTYDASHQKKEDLPIDEGCLFRYDDCLPAEWYEEGISAKAMRKFNIKMDFSNNQIIIPHYNINDELIGVRCRNLDKFSIMKAGKYMPVCQHGIFLAHCLGKHLYGANKNKNNIKRLKSAIILEGEKSVMKCEDYLKSNNVAVAVCGSSISDEQIRLLQELGVEDVTIALDKMYIDAKSEEAKKYRTKLIKLGMKFPSSMSVYYIWDNREMTTYKSSPVDFGPKIFALLYNNRKLIKEKENGK